MLDPDGFSFGIEHEFPAIDSHGGFCDFSNSTFDELDRVIRPLPVIESDYPGLRVGDLGIKRKRWYIEGFERFSETGEYLYTDPKGYEIRTPVSASIDEALATLEGDIALWEAQARAFGYRAGRTSLNPYRTGYVPEPPLNSWELADRTSPEEQTAHIHMLTYGPDISFSHPEMTTERSIDIGRKLTFYSPCIVPFSYSSPFFAGALWGGYSRRTFYRTGARPSVLVFVEKEADIVSSFPTLTDKARLHAEVGRIEFKAFDCPREVGLFRALAALLLGIALDETLPGRATVPDEARHKHSATHAFDDPELREGARAVLDAATAALPNSLRPSLEPLEQMLSARATPAHEMIELYRQTADIITAIS